MIALFLWLAGGDDRIILGKFWRVVLTCSCDGDRKRPVID